MREQDPPFRDWRRARVPERPCFGEVLRGLLMLPAALLAAAVLHAALRRGLVFGK